MRILIGWNLLFLMLAAAAGCREPLPKDLKAAAESLDVAAETLEEFGVVTMSAPLLSGANGPNANFDLNRESEKYFDEASTRIQGAAKAFTQSSLYVRGGVKGSFDPVGGAAESENIRKYERNTARFAAQREHLDLAAARSLGLRMEAALKEPDLQIRNEKIRDAKLKYADAMSVAEQKFPTIQPNNVPGLAKGGIGKDPTEARSVLANKAVFEDAGGLLPANSAPQISDREALLIAAGDKTVETALRMLASPGESFQFSNRRMLLAASTVSVDPGWRTRENFAVDLTVHIGITYVPARRAVIAALLQNCTLPIPGLLKGQISQDYDPPLGKSSICTPSVVDDGTIPQSLNCDPKDPEHPENKDLCGDDKDYTASLAVSAVSPLADNQTLNLTSSLRDMQQWSLGMAGALSKAGFLGQADYLQQYVKSQQRDVNTANAVGVANSYAAAQSIFGYQIGPRLRGLGNPTGGNKSVNVLERQSFPVLILISADQSDLTPRVRQDPQTGKIEVFEPNIRFTQKSRWIPLEHHWYSTGSERFGELERAEIDHRFLSGFAAASTDSKRNPDDPCEAASIKSKSDLEKKAWNMMCPRREALAYLLRGSFVEQELPVDVIVPNKAPGLPKLSGKAADDDEDGE
jgi:hypothetical protein